MEEYTEYRNECVAMNIVPISFYEFIRPRLRLLPNDEDLEEEDDPEILIQEPVVDDSADNPN
jgi:hypothetical protein